MLNAHISATSDKYNISIFDNFSFRRSEQSTIETIDTHSTFAVVILILSIVLYLSALASKRVSVILHNGYELNGIQVSAASTDHSHTVLEMVILVSEPHNGHVPARSTLHGAPHFPYCFGYLLRSALQPEWHGNHCIQYASFLLFFPLFVILTFTLQVVTASSPTRFAAARAGHLSNTARGSLYH